MVRFTSFFALPLLGLLASCSSAPDTPVASAPAAASTTPAKPAAAAKPNILFFGNSLTAGLGVEPDEAFPALIGQKIDSAGLKYRVINAGLSGETTAGGRSRVGWVLSRQPVAVFVLELGGNDGLRALPPASTAANLRTILDVLQARRIPVLLSGMLAPPNLGQEYGNAFRNVFTELGTRPGVIYDPFFLEGVAGEAALNQPDRIHPNAEGVRRIVARLLPAMERLVAAVPP